MSSSEACTDGITVRVRARFVPEHSEPARRRWFFVYTVQISNGGSERVQLISRRWTITDAHGIVRRVEGEGVVGEQPILAPGEGFEYTSACPLETPFGTMEGSYRMTREDGSAFDVAIAGFSLSTPHGVN
ncbi:MAG: Co2+/Mg2+ efflux protein ApaG [Myxococcales bacterium]|nr:Co2+/Mg2+ efflux protein ApaG [Myxococcales bacterium]